MPTARTEVSGLGCGPEPGSSPSLYLVASHRSLSLQWETMVLLIHMTTGKTILSPSCLCQISSGN